MTRTLRAVLLGIVITAAAQTHAAGPTPTGFAGVSASKLTSPFTAYGGIAGSCTGDGTAPCNSCTSSAVSTSCTTAPLCSCNENKIYDNLTVRIALKKPDGTTATGPACAATSAGTSGTRTQLSISTNDGNYVDLKWQSICQAMGSTGGCDPFTGTATTLSVDVWWDKGGTGGCLNPGSNEQTQVTFKVAYPGGTSYNVYGNPTEGIGAFRPYPGDEKIYVESLNTTKDSGFPLLSYSSTRATKVRVFISPNSMDDANYTSPLKPVDLDLDSDGFTLANQVVDGLTNDKLYFFRIAVVDEASNVVLYFPDSTVLASNCTGTTATADCIYAATPSQVQGILSKDLNCFIATAAYGSTLEPKLSVFREFRRRFLLLNRWGLAFVHKYYHYGPYAARYIADKPALRAVARVLLWPAYAFAYAALKFGFGSAVAATLIFLTALTTLPYVWFAKARARV